MSSDFGYVNARVRGLSSKLLEDDFFVQALGDSDFRAFTGSLAQSPYGADLEEAQGSASGLRSIDRAVARNFFRTTRSLLTFSDGDPRHLIGLVLRRYDLANLKAIARAKHAGRSVDEVQAALLPAGELKPGLLDSLASEADLPAVSQALAVTRHPLGRAFGRATRRYAQDGDLYEFELALDRSFYVGTMAGIKGMDVPDAFLRHLRLEIDATNLRTALKLRGQPANGDALFVRGGREISRSTFDAILADPGKGALSALAGGAFAAVADADSLGEAEPHIRVAIDRSAGRVANADPLGIGVVLKFLRRKEAEGAKLRLLARGKFYDVPREQLERELVHA
jgi:V/A-type H+-transporting ATPase subunit C